MALVSRGSLDSNAFVRCVAKLKLFAARCGVDCCVCWVGGGLLWLYSIHLSDFCCCSTCSLDRIISLSCLTCCMLTIMSVSILWRASASRSSYCGFSA